MRTLAATALLVCISSPAVADVKIGGRVTFGSAWRLESPDPAFINTANGAQLGLVGTTTGGVNSDDSNLNFGKHDATSTVLKAYVDVDYKEGERQGLLRLKAWYDYTLKHAHRPWGNIPNRFQADAPLSDEGAASGARFAGALASDAWLQDSWRVSAGKLTTRAGWQLLPWGEKVSMTGGLSALNASDQAALRRPGSSPQETKVPAPMLFARLEANPSLAFEGFWQFAFKPSTLDECGTFWSLGDWQPPGCDKVFAGLPLTSDRQRTVTGTYLKRISSPFSEDGSNFGGALHWRMLDSDFSFYRAQYTNRLPSGSLRKTQRAVGAALIPGDPDGKNLAYFTEFVDGIGLYALSASHKSGKTNWYGEVSYRPNQPIQLSPGDALGAFISSTSVNLLRAEANALPLGAYFHGYDRYGVTNAVGGVTTEVEWAGRTHNALFEVVAKEVSDLPDPWVRRYGRADQYGLGAIGAVCLPSTADLVHQCSQDGYVSRRAWAYRLRFDSRWGEVGPGLQLSSSVMLTHDVKGWSYDLAINQGRKMANLGLRLEWLGRYTAEVTWAPIWGGDYNALSDRDQLSLAVGAKF